MTMIDAVAAAMRKAPILAECTISDYLSYNVADAIDLGALRGDKFHGLDIVREAEIEAVEMALMRFLARAALEAMMKPAPAMLQVGLSGIQNNMDTDRDSYDSRDYPTEATAYHCIVAAIQAALDEEQR